MQNANEIVIDEIYKQADDLLYQAKEVVKPSES